MEENKPTTEELILQAAEAVFLEKGLAGARMQEIADRAGINKALLHYYFQSKDKLSEVVINRTMGQLVPRLFAVLDAELELFDKIRRVVDEYVTFLTQHRALPLFIINELHRNPQFFTVLIARPQALAGFQQQVAAAVQQGHIRPISAAQLLLNVVSMLIFPFLGGPLFQAVLGLSEAAFNEELERRRTAVADFVIQALRV